MHRFTWLRHPNLWIITTLCIAPHVGLSLLFNFVTPVFEGPDEPNHYLYIRYLQLQHRLPVQGTARDAVRAHHPPAYFALGALLTALVAPPASVTSDFSSLGLQLNPRYWFRFDDPEPENKSVFLHHAPPDRFPYAGLARTIHVARLLSLGFTSLAIALTYLGALQLRPADRRFAVLAAGLVAFNPMVAFMSGVVQNDASALAAGAAVLASLGWLLRRGGNPWRWLAVGTLFALGILFKAGTLVLAPLIALVASYDACRAGPGWRYKVRSLAQAALCLALPVAVFDGWWFVRNQMLYGDWTANASIVALWGPLSSESQRQFLPLALYTLSTGILGRFGNGGIIEFSHTTYALAGLLALIALAGAARLLAQRRSAMTPDVAGLQSLRRSATSPDVASPEAPPQPMPDRGTMVLWTAHALTLIIVSVSVVIFALKFNGGATGKYLFPMFPSLALVLAAGWLAWFPLRWRSWAAGGPLGLTLAASVYAVFGLLLPAYGPPRRPLPFEMNSATPLEANLGGDARLLAYHLDRQQVRPGETLKLTVYWLPEATTPVPYTVFVHLHTDALGSLTQRDLYPGGGTYPTTVWVPGRLFVDTYYLHLPADAPAASNAQILIGLYDEQTGQRLTATGGNAGPPGTDWIQFGKITIAP